MMLMTMEFPLDREIMTTVRLATGGLSALAGFGLDGAEDCKVCVTESLLLLLHAGCTSARIEFERQDGLSVSIAGKGYTEREKTVEEEISVALLNALVDRLEIGHEGNGMTVRFLFRGL